jgi:hypothetical protein
VIGGPYFATDARRTPTGILPGIAKLGISRLLAGNLRDAKAVWHRAALTQLGSCHGLAGGAPAAGVGGGVPAERIPLGTLGAAGRDSHQDTETQTSTFL